MPGQRGPPSLAGGVPHPDLVRTGVPPPPGKDLGPVTGVPPRKDMGPVDVLWDGNEVAPIKNIMGPVEVLWDEDDIHPSDAGGNEISLKKDYEYVT